MALARTAHIHSSLKTTIAAVCLTLFRCTMAFNLTMTASFRCLPASRTIMPPFPSDCYASLWMMTKDPYFTVPRTYAHITYIPPSGSKEPVVERRTPLTWSYSTCKIVIDTQDLIAVDTWEVKDAWRRAWDIHTSCLDKSRTTTEYVGGIAPLGKQGFEVFLRGRNVGDIFTF